jgi:hypothetical protein
MIGGGVQAGSGRGWMLNASAGSYACSGGSSISSTCTPNIMSRTVLVNAVVKLGKYL